MSFHEGKNKLGFLEKPTNFKDAVEGYKTAFEILDMLYKQIEHEETQKEIVSSYLAELHGTRLPYAENARKRLADIIRIAQTPEEKASAEKMRATFITFCDSKNMKTQLIPFDASKLD